MTYTTDERLKSFLDTNQLHREQMCLAILALDRRFTEVQPRHPRGGPDGGRDIQANFRGSQIAYGAVGFMNQATDSKEHKTAIRKKFRKDLQSAIEADPSPSVFVFLTNLNFTIAEKNQLVAAAKKKGLASCEIFDRERLRIDLDGVDGMAIRFQYLDIPLSQAEQATFFARWGDDINAVITTGFQKIQKTLDQLLFLQEANESITGFYVTFELDKPYPAEEIGHFRAFCSVWLTRMALDIMNVMFGSCDREDRHKSDAVVRGRPGIKNGIYGMQWEHTIDHDDDNKRLARGEELSDEKYKISGTSSSLGQETVEFITISYSKGSFLQLGPTLKLRDFDGCMLLPMVNRSLAHRLKRIHILSNGYTLHEMDKASFIIDESQFKCKVPARFDEGELSDPWVRIRPSRGSAVRLDFSDEVPVRMYEAKQANDSLAARAKHKRLQSN